MKSVSPPVQIIGEVKKKEGGDFGRRHSKLEAFESRDTRLKDFVPPPPTENDEPVVIPFQNTIQRVERRASQRVSDLGGLQAFQQSDQMAKAIRRQSKLEEIVEIRSKQEEEERRLRTQFLEQIKEQEKEQLLLKEKSKKLTKHEAEKLAKIREEEEKKRLKEEEERRQREEEERKIREQIELENSKMESKLIRKKKSKLNDSKSSIKSMGLKKKKKKRSKSDDSKNMDKDGDDSPNKNMLGDIMEIIQEDDNEQHQVEQKEQQEREIIERRRQERERRRKRKEEQQKQLPLDELERNIRRQLTLTERSIKELEISESRVKWQEFKAVKKKNKEDELQNEEDDIKWRKEESNRHQQFRNRVNSAERQFIGDNAIFRIELFSPRKSYNNEKYNFMHNKVQNPSYYPYSKLKTKST